ncbi:MAG: hypothetical protein H7323_02980, partial [Frankiales bacterium]|nr:hypothetical protein [Frankiales bacterium]
PAQGLTSGVQEDSHYYAFELGNLPAGTRLLLSVRALADGPLAAGAEPEARGSWQFVLVPRK